MSELLPSEVLAKAADLIEPEGAWTQGAYARSAMGYAVGCLSAEAVCWCAYGTIDRLTNRQWDHPANNYFLQATGYTPGAFNDTPGRKQSEVVAALRKAAELAREVGR